MRKIFQQLILSGFCLAIGAGAASAENIVIKG